ncbi:Discs large homolog 1-like protein [Geodia barretti]|uniref:Discs large homolog 1-like protein n=1 Tax=Geodia barretti TaxID=519541 RepID=A0AA35SL41_GEOBA|nr:Discs large homolog 1-like protein [Geodia barretti]
MAMEVKSVELERQTTASNPNGTFGFSVLGGSGTKFPAVVCEIDAGGPADLCGKIRVGDRLVSLNGEELDNLTPNELVQRIRSAPSPSSFVLGEDEGVREQVLSLLKKQEKRAQARQQRAQQQQQVHKGVPPVLGKEEKDKRKKIIEIEPPVNRAGGGDVIVQPLWNASAKLQHFKAFGCWRAN